MSALPPLPQGWTEHIEPNGQVYYYGSVTRESTYIRPLPTFPFPTSSQSQNVERKKEKPLFKRLIPGTDWLRVRTSEGNIFYSHKVRKVSVWTVPEEIKEQVELLHEEDRRREEQSRAELGFDVQRGRTEEMEIERIKNEVQDLVKRKAEQAFSVNEATVPKKARIDDSSSEESEEDMDDDEEEDWQKEAAEKLAAEAEAQKIAEEQRKLEDMKKREENNVQVDQVANQTLQLSIPDRVDLSMEEAKALFKTLLREKDVNPLHPWDKSLPSFVSDPRYVLLPSVTARREAFDEYCRERARELKQLRNKKEMEGTDPKEEFEKLLRDEVQSTRTTWTDFRRTWKKDRRFYGWGRDEREREKRFRDFIKELGEKKRAAAERAEADFIALLSERLEPKEDLSWKDVKKGLYNDSRYDAVGSSSLREELFNTFLKGKPMHPLDAAEVEKDLPKDELGGKRKRKEQALKEREEKVKAERDRLDVQIERSKQGLGKEEGERLFRTLLTDAIRDPQTWETALPQLKIDPRFVHSTLTLNNQLQLFHSHVAHLRDKHLSSLHALFQSHALSLASKFTDLPISSLLSSLPVTKLSYDIMDLEQEYAKWQRERFQACRGAFDGMLSENSFVEFWGRLGKIGGEGVDGFVKADEMEEGEGEGGGGSVDMKVLAKNIDIFDMEKVIKNDKRYTAFDHVPEQREKWIRDYLANLSAPRFSVHVPERGAS